MRPAVKIGILKDKGVDYFRDYLTALRQGATSAPPHHLLVDPRFSAPLRGGAEIEQLTFSTRLDLARYLHSVLAVSGKDSLESDVSLWSWLSLFYFDQICPVGKRGLRKPGKDYRYILEPGYPNGHRHLLAGTYLVYTVYGLGEDLSRLLLWSPLHLESKFHHQLAARQTLVSNKAIVEAAHRMYFDTRAGKPRKGATAEKKAPGTLNRFVAVLQQLDLTYDLYGMNAREILALLPPEFNQWIDNRGWKPLPHERSMSGE
jgi:hypothetical protein